MILLDTDHVTVLRMPPSARQSRLVARLALVTDETVGIPVIVVEEAMRGWIAAIARERQVYRQIPAYRELTSLFGFFAEVSIAPFEAIAASRFEALGSSGIGFRDRKIAAIALADNALLLTANRRHFERVPNLRFENWMDASPPTRPTAS